jgi:methylenetetrahydrofolate--tRNA-(uracil-5-)-methyltransferase
MMMAITLSTVTNPALPCQVAVIGAGLAGCEAALQLADRGINVRLHDLKPANRSAAHHSNNLAEIVCSNSFGSLGATASGLLKQELQLLGCQLIPIATQCSVPAGQALAVDRELFSEAVTRRIANHAHIQFVPGDITTLPTDVVFTIVATGPLTSEGLVETLQTLMKRGNLYFFDAASPIVTKESVDFSKAFVQDRYNKTVETHASEASYINCPLDKEQYLRLHQFLLDAEKTPLKAFEEAQNAIFFESCMPVEIIASRGVDTLRYGPMKPVGLENPHKEGEQPYAVVQLRQDNTEGTLYNLVGFQTNLKWGAQKTLMSLIPGLEEAEVVRYGVMHRNTFIHSPEVLLPTLQLKHQGNLLMAGQLTGTEGYTESIATGLFAALMVERQLRGEPPVALDRKTMLGSLLHYITREEAIGQSFQPINSNWGIMQPLGLKIKSKKERAGHYIERSLEALRQWQQEAAVTSLQSCSEALASNLSEPLVGLANG